MGELIPQKVRDLAAGIADNIEAKGHYQGEGVMYDPTNYVWDGRCCILANPAYLDVDPCDEGIQLERLLPGPTLQWNDTTPTAEVLATLRKIAAGEKP